MASRHARAADEHQRRRRTLLAVEAEDPGEGRHAVLLLADARDRFQPAAASARHKRFGDD